MQRILRTHQDYPHLRPIYEALVRARRQAQRDGLTVAWFVLMGDDGEILLRTNSELAIVEEIPEWDYTLIRVDVEVEADDWDYGCFWFDRSATHRCDLFHSESENFRDIVTDGLTPNVWIEDLVTGKDF